MTNKTLVKSSSKTIVINSSISIIMLLIILSAENLSAQIKIKAVGDVMLGSVTPKEFLPPNNGKIFTDSIGQYLSEADIVFGNLEGSFILDGMKAEKCSEESRAKGICYEFGMPESLAPILKQMGFSVMSTDNNHSEDYGSDGYNLTTHLLNRMGIVPAGKRSYAEIYVSGKKIAVVAFGYSSNSYNISDLDSVTIIIQKIKSTHDLVIVSFHGGAEGRNFQRVTGETEIFLGENRGNVSAFAKTVIDAGADLVLGHGPHVLRGIELYKNKLIAYSLGNFLTYGNVNIKDVSGISVILEVIIDKSTGDFVRGRLIPVVQVGNGYPVYDNSLVSINDIRKLNNLDFNSSPIKIFDGGFFFSMDGLNVDALPLYRPEKFEIPFNKISINEFPLFKKVDLK